MAEKKYFKVLEDFAFGDTDECKMDLCFLLYQVYRKDDILEFKVSSKDGEIIECKLQGKEINSPVEYMKCIHSRYLEEIK